MLVALVSAKGAPGVTTTALGLAAMAAGDALVVEVDPAGGDLECWTGPYGEAGLVALASRPHPQDPLSDPSVEVAGDVRAVVAPTTETTMARLLTRSADDLASTLAADSRHVVFADLGRTSSTSPALPVLAAADLTLVVCRPTLDSVEHTRGLLAPGGALDTATGPSSIVVVGGARPYGPDEIARALDTPVAGVLPWAPRAVVALLEQGAGRAWQRSSLAAATAEVVAAVQALAAGARAGG